MANDISGILNDLSGAGRQQFANPSTKISRDDFLKLLFTQLKYQDFESSVDYKDLMTQLSILAQVEQSMNLKDTIDELSKSIARANFFSASNIIGKKAYIEGKTLFVSQGEVLNYPAFSLDIPARDVEVKILGPGGIVVKRIHLSDVDAGKHYVVWDGKNDSGNAVQDGQYSFEIVARDSAGNEFKPSHLTFGKIDSVSLEGNNVFVGIGNLNFEFEKVVAIKDE